MIRGIANALAALSLALKQPLPSFCDIETAHGDALVSKHGDYVSWLRIDGTRRMLTRDDVTRITTALRVEISGTLDRRGHAICASYVSDPDASGVEIARVSLDATREVARLQRLDLHDLLDERAALWPRKMRWEAVHFVLWTRSTVLTKEERRQVRDERNAMARQVPSIGDSQRFYMRSDIMAARHDAFVSRIVRALRGSIIASDLVSPHEGLKLSREALYRETAGSPWKATLPGDRVMPRLPDDEDAPLTAASLLWPNLPRQLFNIDAGTTSGNQVAIGAYEYAHVDMDLGPENPSSFVELSAALAADRIPWRGLLLLEGGGKSAMGFKEGAASLLGIFPTNADLRRAFAVLRELRDTHNHISVRLRASFATWAPVDDTRTLRRRASLLGQRVEGWGGCKTTTLAGDALEGVMSSVPGLSLASTGTPCLAPLGDALVMLPWNRTASPWQEGSVLLRRPDGGIWPYDPSGGAMRPQVLDIFVAPPRSGKSVLANTINLGLCLSSAVLGSGGAKLPLIGKLDIGPTAEGFVRLIQEALGPARRHEAIHVTMQLARGFEVNIFDIQVGCDYPLPLEDAFLRNFLALATLPPDMTTPFEGMSQLIGYVVDEAYRLCTDVQGNSAKRYRRGVEPAVDRALAEHRIELHSEQPWWRDVVAELCRIGEWRLAEVAQRHAVPILQDLIQAARTEQVKDAFGSLRINITSEAATELFTRYITDLIKRFPTLNHPTKLDFGPARIIVIDLAAVAPTGSAQSDRQTEMMYMLGRHILARNFFLHPEYADYVPDAVRPHHRQRFGEIKETVKRLDYDEWHRTKNSPQVQAQAERDVLEGPKHNVQLGFTSQRLSHMSKGIASQATGRFVLKAGDQDEAEEIITRFNLSQAGADVVRYGLGGPGAEGAPFLIVLDAGGERWEQKLVNQLGPVELWALSTTPADTALRGRLYDRLGFSEGLRRLSRVFPAGSAEKEIERRKKERLGRGEGDDRATAGVVDELARELVDGEGLGIVLRPREDGPRPAAILPIAAE